MGTIERFTVASPSSYMSERVMTPWCNRCENKSRVRAHVAIRTHILAMKAAIMMQDDDGTVRKCLICCEKRPTALFAWKKDGGNNVSRRRVCIDCQVNKKERNKRPLTPSLKSQGVLAPFDIAEAQIVVRTGKPIERWGRTEHHVHCILMRELAGISHTPPPSPGHVGITYPKAEIARWNRIGQRVRAWAGL